MRELTTALIAVVLGACAASTQLGGTYDSASSLWEKSKERAEYRTYQLAFTNSQNQQRLDDDSGCYDKDPGKQVILILVVDSKGLISDTYADNTSAKAECFKAAYLGAQMPIPPFSPFPMKMQMN